jgi:UDP-N-acetylmuramoyl-tripeptide--D-alanyl-D-alanine ligase
MNIHSNSSSAVFSESELRNIFGDEACKNLHLASPARGVSTDTRRLESGNIFVALRGERFNGNALAGEALLKGAAAAIVDSLPDALAALQASSQAGKDAERMNNPPFIIVPDALAALGALARFHRRRFSIPFVAVAGSAGKTTTKEMTAHLLQEKYAVLKTEGNWNNQIGAPLTLLRLCPSHEIAVVEIGTNEPGEIALLSAIVEPTHGLITNIGKEHLEKLRDEDGVEHEETALFRYLASRGGKAFVNADDKRLRKYKRSGWTSYGFSSAESPDIEGSLAPASENEASAIANAPAFQPEVLRIADRRNGREMRAALRAVGSVAARNALAATAVALEFGVSEESVKRALESFAPTTSEAGYGRMAFERWTLADGRRINVVNDCYNANPISMYAALETLREAKAAGAGASVRKIAVLGDMRELGEHSLAEHDALLEYVRTASWLQWVVLVGEEMRRAYERHIERHETTQTIAYCASNALCAETLKQALRDDDVVLLKASRGIRLEEAILALRS